MADDKVVCPSCGTEIPLTQALTANIEKRLRADLLLESKRREAELAMDFEKRLAQEREDVSAKAREKLGVEIDSLKQALEEKTAQLKVTQEQELALLKREREVNEKLKSAELDVQRRLSEERSKIEDGVSKRLAEEHKLTDAQKDNQLQSLRDQIEELKRKASQGSQQAQGEAAELDLESFLRAQFPHDDIAPVPKGIRGVDVVQRVADLGGRCCGTIAWEIKNTKNWSDAWLAKLREDQRELKADVAVIVSTVLPREIERFGFHEGVWVSDLGSVLGLGTALRLNLVHVARAKAASEGRDTKMDSLYQYLIGTGFRQRVEVVAEAFVTMKEDLDRERRSIEAQWAKREKQLGLAIAGLAGMYGDMQGIVGSPLPKVARLQIAVPELLDDSVDAS
jgi:hypothetical protein